MIPGIEGQPANVDLAARVCHLGSQPEVHKATRRSETVSGAAMRMDKSGIVVENAHFPANFKNISRALLLPGTMYHVYINDMVHSSEVFKIIHFADDTKLITNLNNEDTRNE